MHPHSLVARLCIKATQAEFDGRMDDARDLGWQAWEAAQDDYEACMAAHYVARYQESPQGALRWHQEALARADAAGDERVGSFYASLYVNLGRAHEVLGNLAQAAEYYRRAADLGLVHQGDAADPDAGLSGVCGTGHIRP
jgi:hypothetical protein